MYLRKNIMETLNIHENYGSKLWHHSKAKMFRQLLNCIRCNKNNFCTLQKRFLCEYLSTWLSSDFKIAWYVQNFESFDFSRRYTESWFLSNMVHQGVYSFLMRLTQSNSQFLCLSYSFWTLLFCQTEHL